MRKKANPLAWLSGLFTLVAVWGCQKDREQMVSMTDVSERRVAAFTDPAPPARPAEQSYFKTPWWQESQVVLTPTGNSGLDTFTKSLRWPSQAGNNAVVENAELSSVEVTQ